MITCQMFVLRKLPNGDDDYFSPAIRCREPATTRCWCPTWITNPMPPMHLCDEHAKRFQPEHNPHASGTFYWNEQADQAYAEYLALNNGEGI